jgi:hypothetical protein
LLSLALVETEFLLEPGPPNGFFRRSPTATRDLPSLGSAKQARTDECGHDHDGDYQRKKHIRLLAGGIDTGCYGAYGLRTAAAVVSSSSYRDDALRAGTRDRDRGGEPEVIGSTSHVSACCAA